MSDTRLTKLNDCLEKLREDIRETKTELNRLIASKVGPIMIKPLAPKTKIAKKSPIPCPAPQPDPFCWPHQKVYHIPVEELLRHFESLERAVKALKPK